MVGHSLRALVARIYAGRFPEESVGIVFVDHASDFRVSRESSKSRNDGDASPVPPAPSLLRRPLRLRKYTESKTIRILIGCLRVIVNCTFGGWSEREIK